jgi:hypothetical protein
MSSFGNQKHLFRKITGSLLPDKISAILPQTTNFFTLIGQVADPIGNVFGGVKESNRTPKDFDIMIPRSDLTSSKHIIQNRFSAPGGPEVNSRGYRDVATGEYSVYNALNYRNLSVRGSGSGEPEHSSANIPKSIRVYSHARRREGLRTLLARHCGQFGTDSQWGSVSGISYETEPSFYKQHRNTLVTPRIKDQRLSKALYIPSSVAHLRNSSMPYPWPTTGDISFSFWINPTDTNAFCQIFDDPNNSISMRLQADSMILKVNDSSGVSATVSMDYDKENEWNHIIVCWPSSPSFEPRFYINGKKQTVSTFFNAGFNYLRNTTNDLYVLSDVGNHELRGSLSNLAVYTSFFTDVEAMNLYNNNGNPFSISSPNSLVDYWLLGEEKSFSSIAVGAPIGGFVTVASQIGKNTLTANGATNIVIADGPYEINTFEDVNKHDNMHYASLLPRSDFQYSWINSAISGSNWIQGQKVRGFAPKSGEIRLIGGGSLVKMESAITFPSSSTLYGE